MTDPILTHLLSEIARLRASNDELIDELEGTRIKIAELNERARELAEREE